MDEAYASPDSDGHASLPSPTDSTFDMSHLPLKRRGRQQEPIMVSSSFVNAPTEDDSDDDDEGDDTFIRNSLARESLRMLPSSPAMSSATKPRSKILTPMNAKNDDNTPRNTPRRAVGPREDVLRENIDPNEGQKNRSKKPSPPRLRVHKPDNGSSDEGEEAAVDRTLSIASNMDGGDLDAGAVEGFVRASEAQSASPELGTPFGDAYGRSLDSLIALQQPPVNAALVDSPGYHSDPIKRVSPRKSRKSLIPIKAATPPPARSSPPLPGSPQPVGARLNLTPETPRLRYLNWLSSDSIDEADPGSTGIPAGHSARTKKAQAQRIIDETAFLGGDEASFLAEDGSVNGEMLDTFHRGSAEAMQESFFDEAEDPDESRLTVLSEESLPTAPLNPISSSTAHVASNSDVGMVRQSSGGSQDHSNTHGGVGNIGGINSTQRSVSPTLSPKRELKQLAPESQDSNGRPAIDNAVISELVGQYPTPDSATSKPLGFGSTTPTPSGIIALIEDGSSTGILLDQTKAQVPDFSVGTSTTPQFFSTLAKDSDRIAMSTLLEESMTREANPSERSRFLDGAVGPSLPQDRKQKKPMESMLAGLSTIQSPQQSPEDENPFHETTTQNFLSSDIFLAQSTPQHFHGMDLWALKKSGRGRRVSMNTPPSTLERSLSGTEILNNPPEFSSLGSGFSFPSVPVRYDEWDPDSVAREFTPPFPVEGLNNFKRLGRLQGYNPPQNTPTPAAGKGAGGKTGLAELVSMMEGKGRARSKSDPVENKIGGETGKGLFTPTRLRKRVSSQLGDEEEEEEHDNLNNAADVPVKSVFSDGSESPVKTSSEPAGGQDNDDGLDNDPGLDLSDSEKEHGGRHWSGFTQDFGGRYALDKGEHEAGEHNEPSADPSSLSLGNVEFRVHTPVSIGESKDATNDISDGSNKTLWLRMAQAEAENDRFRKLLEDNNIKIGIQDLASSAGNLTAIMHDSRDMSTRSSDFNVSTSEDVGSLKRRLVELEGLLEILGRRDAELRSENDRKDNLLMHWRTQYNDAQNHAVQNRQRAMSLENHIKNLEQQAAVDNINHGREINKVVSKLHTEKQDVIKHSRQKSIGLEDRAKFFEQRLHDAQEAHRRDTEEKERTISHLRQALDRRGSMPQNGLTGNGDANLIVELQEKLYEQQQAHETDTNAQEAKFTNLLEEKEGLVRHLQAELDEMVNLMPVDHGSSRMIDEEEAEDWLDEKSREISQYYDDGLDQIITELHGSGEREDFEEAVEEAEMSLRRVAEEAGLDEPLDKATLAAFGIRNLRAEFVMIKRLLIESEGRVKGLMQVNDELGRRGEQAEKLRISEEQREAFKTVAMEAEAAGKMLADQVDSLRAKLVEAEKHIRHLVAENKALDHKCTDAEERAAGFEADKAALQHLVNDTKLLNDMLKSQATEAEKRNQGFEEEILGLRRQLAEEKEHVSVVETETITFRQQITEWEEAAAARKKEKEELQALLKDSQDHVKVIEREKGGLKKQLDEVAKEKVSSKETEALRKQVKEMQDRLKVLGQQQSASSVTISQLEQKLAHGDQAAQRLSAEKEFLKAELEIAANETKAARGRFAQLLHDTAEKEAKWTTVRQELESKVLQSGEGSMGSVLAYRKSLSLIVQEIEKDTHSHHSEDGQSLPNEKLDISSIDGLQDPELVNLVVQAFRWRDRRLVESEERNKRYKGAAKKWMKENEKKRGRVEELVAENRELGLKLKAEKKSNDEKMGQMILALRRGE